MGTTQFGYVAVVGYGLVMVGHVLLGLFRGEPPNGLVLAGGVMIVGGGVVRLHNDPEENRPRLHAGVNVVAFVLAIIAFVWEPRAFVGV